MRRRALAVLHLSKTRRLDSNQSPLRGTKVRARCVDGGSPVGRILLPIWSVAVQYNESDCRAHPNIAWTYTGKAHINALKQLTKKIRLIESSLTCRYAAGRTGTAGTLVARVGSPAALARGRRVVAPWRELNAGSAVTTSPTFGGSRYPLHQPLSSSASLSGRARDESG